MNTTTLPPVQDSITPDTPTEQIAHILSAQNQFFQSGATLAQAFRVKQLTTLKQAIHAYHEQIEIALKQDLNKSVMETYVSEVALVLDEIDFMLKHLAHLMKPKHVKTPTSHFPAKAHYVRAVWPCAEYRAVELPLSAVYCPDCRCNGCG